MSLCAFPLLSNLDQYEPVTFPMFGLDPKYPGLKDWVDVFRKSIKTFVDHALQDTTVDPSKREELSLVFSHSFSVELQNVLAAEESGNCNHIDCIYLSGLRDRCLHDAGFGDIFAALKERENLAALALLPSVLEDLESHLDKRNRLELIIRGMLAGNIFDMGATATAELFTDKGTSFMETRNQLLPRPWVIDHLDSVVERLASHRYQKAIIFVDNAGCDVVLGVLPLSRELLSNGTTVVLAANSQPTLNDITAAELGPLLESAAAADSQGVFASALSEKRLRVVESGNPLPVIDLRKVSGELAAEAEDTDLVIMVGMGRSIETNLNVKLRCDVMKVAMVKHPEVAVLMGGRLYDCVVRYDPAVSFN